MGTQKNTIRDVKYALSRNKGKTLLRFRISYDDNKTWDVVETAEQIDFSKTSNIIIEFKDSNPIFLKLIGKY